MMNFRGLTCTIIILLILCAYPQPGWPSEGAIIFGTVGLERDDGTFVPGSMLRIFLATSAIDVPDLHLDKLDKFKRLEAVNTAHIDFFKYFKDRSSVAGYLQANIVSSTSGTFQFDGIPPGRYFVLVTFPSMVDGKKVAWQVPVVIEKDRYVWIKLQKDNLVLPAVSR